jgi:phosphotransferase system  glucose/maltose/N-acetylglucosamine-specific IIC component
MPNYPQYIIISADTWGWLCVLIGMLFAFLVIFVFAFFWIATEYRDYKRQQEGPKLPPVASERR